MERTSAMQKMRLAKYLWPGLPRLLVHGSWTALAIAVGAGVLLNAAVLCTFGWSEMIDVPMRNLLWASVAVLWIGSALVAAVQLHRLALTKELSAQDDPFHQALELYLKGDYYQAEGLLQKLLKNNARDLDARLLLATLFRHTRRIEEAEKQLEQMVLFEGAEKWGLEIDRERELLGKMKKNLENNSQIGTPIAPEMNPVELEHAA
ncbi:MAG: tetratricopeptide repeat protein [Thermoguttaceae bacterium]